LTVGFAEERELVERALAASDQDDGEEIEFPPVAARFTRAREAVGLSQAEVAERWHQPPSMYWDLEFHDSEAFDVISIDDLVSLARILRVTPNYLLFGGEPSSPVAPVSYSEVVRRLREKMEAEKLSVDRVGDIVNVEMREYFQEPERLGELPIFLLRGICQFVGVDWAATLTRTDSA
jgi:transcriptional regulator with XRE-family HTH domain